jgi:hypothetical protein
MKKKKKTNKRVVSLRFVSFRSVPLSIAFVLSFFLSVVQSVLMGRERRVVNGQSVSQKRRRRRGRRRMTDAGAHRWTMDDG